jgi:hypothetical protein
MTYLGQNNNILCRALDVTFAVQSEEEDGDASLELQLTLSAPTSMTEEQLKALDMDVDSPAAESNNDSSFAPATPDDELTQWTSGDEERDDDDIEATTESENSVSVVSGVLAEMVDEVVRRACSIGRISLSAVTNDDIGCLSLSDDEDDAGDPQESIDQTTEFMAAQIALSVADEAVERSEKAKVT